MKKLILLLLVVTQSVVAQNAAAPKTEPGEQHEFVIANFKTDRKSVV